MSSFDEAALCQELQVILITNRYLVWPMSTRQNRTIDSCFGMFYLNTLKKSRPIRVLVSHWLISKRSRILATPEAQHISAQAQQSQHCDESWFSGTALFREVPWFHVVFRLVWILPQIRLPKRRRFMQGNNRGRKLSRNEGTNLWIKLSFVNVRL